MTLATIKKESFTFEVNENSPKEIIQMFVRRPEIIDIFYNIKAGTFAGLMVDDEHIAMVNRPDAYDLEYIYLPFLLNHGLVSKSQDYLEATTSNLPLSSFRLQEYTVNYTDIFVNPNIGRSNFTHMVLQRSNVFNKSLPDAKPENSIAGIVVGTDNEEYAQEMFREFKELTKKWHDFFANVCPNESNQSRFTLTILGESACVSY